MSPIISVLDGQANALGTLYVPNLIRWAFSFFTQALAELGIPVEVNWTHVGAAFAGTRAVVPVVARRANLRPFAQAHAFLPVPVLVIRALD
jgi:hypothetical protein